MTLNEKQLADMFQKTSNASVPADLASDCLTADEASSTRLNKTEQLMDNHATAQAMKMALALKEWSHAMAQSVKNSQRSWLNILGFNSPLKTTVATMTFALAIVAVLPQLNSIETVVDQTTTIQMQSTLRDDIIVSNQFEGSDDILTTNGFDQPSEARDTLFSGNFG